MITGFNNTYIGDFVGALAADESNTIRIGDVSNGNGSGSLECYIGGVFNNFQPVGGSVVVVTLDRADDHLGWDFGPSSVVAHLCNVVHRNVVARPACQPAPRHAQWQSWQS